MPHPSVQDPSPSVPCCSPLASAPLSEDEAADVARVLKAVADPTRMRMLSLMLADDDGEACTCDLTDVLGLTQPTVTHHLRKLVAAGLVRVERRAGAFTYYRVVPAALAGLAAVFAPAPAAASVDAS